MKKLILLLLLVFLSCGEVSRNFIEPSKEQLETISSGFTENIVVEGYCAINIKPVYDGIEYDDVYFIALRLSREYKTLNTKEDIGIGVWVLGAGDSLYSVNDIAKESSLHPPSNVISMKDDEAIDVKNCLNK